MNTARTLPWADAVPDAALLARYAADRDEAAFAVLVRRHGPTVFGVCLRNAGHRQNAEDAFQAVFLLLARRAGELEQPERLANWLYGVAVRVARKARRAALRRRTHEAKAVPSPRPAAGSDWFDVSPVLDDELLKLSDDHRAAVLLCDVQGLSRADAAVRLGIPEGTLSSRLNAARTKLVERLSTRGVTLGLGALAANATAAVPDELAGQLSHALTAFHASGAIPAPLADLLTGGTFPMRTKLLALLATATLGSVGVLAAWPADEPKPVPQPKAKADPPKAEAPKAEVPPREDFGRPPREKRAKLVEKYTADTRMTNPVWSPDGTRLYASAGGQKASSATDPREFESVGVRLLRPELQPSFVALLADGKEYVTFSSGSGVNSVRELIGWNAATVARESPANPKKLWSVEIDSEDGTPVALTDDRKFVFAKLDEPAEGAAKAWFRVLNGKTGEPLRELVKPAEGEKLDGWKFSATGDRLFLAVSTAKGGIRLRAVDTATGKAVWDRAVDFATVPLAAPPKVPDNTHLTPDHVERLAKWKFPVQVHFIPSGKWLGVTAVPVIEGGGPAHGVLPGNACLLVDAATGKDGTPLAELGNGDNHLQAISADGTLAVGETGTMTFEPPGNFGGGFGGRGPGGIRAGRRQLVAWHTATGKVLKSWPTDTRLTATFSPKAPLLAVIETGTTRQRIDGTNYQTLVYSTLGLWDLSGLLK